MERTHDPMGAGPTVLLVDDEELLRALPSRMLIAAGFSVVAAENGQAALAAASKLNGSLGLVVTDIHMPVMSGLEFARSFRPLFPRTPVLFITGRDPCGAGQPDLVDAELLQKPFSADAFLHTITRLLSRQTASQNS
jgi:two-component system, cell cycle sensor histidine kinase and response regulator CckA